jgi:hypothetical protein
MTANTQMGQQARANNAKGLSRKNVHRSLTPERRDNDADHPVRVRTGNEAAKPYDRVKPWIELANCVIAFLLGDDGDFATPDEMMEPVRQYITSAEETPSFPASAMRKWFQQSRNKDAARKSMFMLALDVARHLLFFTGQGIADDAFSFDEGPRDTVRFDCRDGTIRASIFDPFHRYFVPAVDGLEAARIRRCEMCWKIYFAKRLKAGSKFNSVKSCSACANKRYQSEHRQRERTRIAQVVKLADDGLDERQIAKQVGISVFAVKPYLTHRRSR